jgi:hypothetical protein
MFEHNWKSTRNINYKSDKLLLNLPNHITNYNFTYIPWYSLLVWVKNKLQNIHFEKNNNIDNNFETFTVEKTSSNMQYIIHNFHTNYQQRPDIFEYLSPYEFSSKVNKINNTCCNQFHKTSPSI